MPKFAANISHLFQELPYAERFAAAKRNGFEAVEVLSPYDQWPETCVELAANGLDLVLINMPKVGTGPALLGEAATPGREDVFRQDVSLLLDLTANCRPRFIHVMSGNGRGNAAQTCFADNLKWLTETVPDQLFTIEPLNGRDRPDYFLNSYDLAAEVLRQVGESRVGLQYDTYHAHLIHGDAMSVWRDYGVLASHIQIGNPPDRSEPGEGPLDFSAFFEAVNASGYQGWISAEYTPSQKTEDTLGWMRLS